MEIHICSITEYDVETRMPTIVNPDSSTFYLVPTEDGTSPDLFTEWVYVNGAWEMFGSMKIDLSGYLTDVTVGGTSVTSDGIANIPLASTSNAGAIQIGTGLTTYNNRLIINPATQALIKAGSETNMSVTPYRQHESTFYGLAKASGTDEKSSTLPVGQYTNEAKSSIQDMLDVPSNADLNEVEEKVEQNTEDLLKAFPVETASGNIASFEDGANGIPLQSLVVDIDPVQDLSQGDPSPENICPISGWDGVNVRRCNENLWDDAWYSLGNAMTKVVDETSDFYGYYGGAVKTWANAQQSNGFTKLFPYGVDRLTVTAELGNFSTSSNFTFRIFFYYSDGTSEYNYNIAVASRSKKTETRASLSGKKCIGFVISTSASTGNPNGAVRRIAVSVDGTTDFIEPVQNPLIPITFGQTVYGGKLDVLSGKLTVYPYYASYNGETLTGEWISDRDVYEVGTTPTIGAQVVNIGAEGTEIQLEPHEVTSLLGANNIFADTGNTAVEYRADPDLYIQRKMPEVPVDDVQINGTSIVTDGVANVPIGTTSKEGVFKVALDANIKAGSGSSVVVPTGVQHKSVFYGLAKAASDTTQSQSSNAVGNYTDSAKDSIQNMLGIIPLIASHESDPFESAHVVGELFIIGGKLYRAKTALTAGEYVNEGTNVEVVSVAGVLDGKVGDVQINGSSIVTGGVANIPHATDSTYGVMHTSSSYGTSILDGTLSLVKADDAQVKAGTTTRKPIVPINQHMATFYGLAKIAGHDEKDSTLPVGTYTPEAKSAIKQMLSIADNYDSFIVDVEGTDPTITGQPSYRYNCGEVLSLTVTPPETGTIDFRFTSGSSPTVLTLPSTVKMPEWWVEVEANTIYEMCITDGVYCGVMTWAI